MRVPASTRYVSNSPAEEYAKTSINVKLVFAQIYEIMFIVSFRIFGRYSDNPVKKWHHKPNTETPLANPVMELKYSDRISETAYRITP
jgi:hypothetical protein